MANSGSFDGNNLPYPSYPQVQPTYSQIQSNSPSMHQTMTQNQGESAQQPAQLNNFSQALHQAYNAALTLQNHMIAYQNQSRSQMQPMQPAQTNHPPQWSNQNQAYNQDLLPRNQVFPYQDQVWSMNQTPQPQHQWQQQQLWRGQAYMPQRQVAMSDSRDIQPCGLQDSYQQWPLGSKPQVSFPAPVQGQFGAQQSNVPQTSCRTPNQTPIHSQSVTDQGDLPPHPLSPPSRGDFGTDKTLNQQVDFIDQNKSIPVQNVGTPWFPPTAPIQHSQISGVGQTGRLADQPPQVFQASNAHYERGGHAPAQPLPSSAQSSQEQQMVAEHRRRVLRAMRRGYMERGFLPPPEDHDSGVALPASSPILDTISSGQAAQSESIGLLPIPSVSSNSGNIGYPDAVNGLGSSSRSAANSAVSSSFSGPVRTMLNSDRTALATESASFREDHDGRPVKRIAPGPAPTWAEHVDQLIRRQRAIERARPPRPPFQPMSRSRASQDLDSSPRTPVRVRPRTPPVTRTDCDHLPEYDAYTRQKNDWALCCEWCTYLFHKSEKRCHRCRMFNTPLTISAYLHFEVVIGPRSLEWWLGLLNAPKIVRYPEDLSLPPSPMGSGGE